jgi:hypothetical protein
VTGATNFDSGKRLASAKARAALAGIGLVESTDDHDRSVFVVSKSAMTKQLPDLDAFDRWLEQVTGKRA